MNKKIRALLMLTTITLSIHAQTTPTAKMQSKQNQREISARCAEAS